jgi:hypothetical protein
MDIRIEIGGFEKFADHFFDGLIADQQKWRFKKRIGSI